MKISNFRGRQRLIEINVTPFVDIMLVLLIVFIVTIPIIQNEVDIHLPNGNASPVKQQKKYDLLIKKDGSVTINGLGTSLSDLPNRLQGLSKEAVVHILADRDTQYSNVIDTISILGENGFTNLSFIVNKL